jgi:hypothetical protein
MPMMKERLLSVWLAYKRLTQLSFPRRFPIVQFPNLSLRGGPRAGGCCSLCGGVLVLQLLAEGVQRVVEP